MDRYANPFASMLAGEFDLSVMSWGHLTSHSFSRFERMGKQWESGNEELGTVTLTASKPTERCACNVFER